MPDLRGKILFTLALLAVYRFIAHVPLPGVDQANLDDVFRTNQLLGFLDLFSGGALRRLSVAALGVFPYITASIVMQLLTPVVPSLQRLSKEGEMGRQKLNRIVHWLTVPIAMAQGYGQLLFLQQARVVDDVGVNLATLAMVISFDYRHHVPGLVGRADHGEGYRQRYLPHHIRRHCSQLSQHNPAGIP